MPGRKGIANDHPSKSKTQTDNDKPYKLFCPGLKREYDGYWLTFIILSRRRKATKTQDPTLPDDMWERPWMVEESRNSFTRSILT